MRVPDPTPIHGAWRADAALVLDRQLVRLASMESRCRLVQADLVAALLDGKRWNEVGFVRLADYSAERLGLRGRTLQQDAHVARGLRGLALVREAFLAGDITWTHLRGLVDVATAADENVWLERATSMKTRAFESSVREHKLQMRARSSAPQAENSPEDGTAMESGNPPGSATTPPGGTSAEAGTSPSGGTSAQHSASPEPGTSLEVGPLPEIDDEPTVRWGTRSSRFGVRLWNHAREMAERVAGSSLTQAQVLELVAAEALSGAPLRSAQAGTPFPTRERRPTVKELHEAAERAFAAEYGSNEGFRWLEAPHRDPGATADLDALLDGAANADGFELDRRLREVRAAMQRIDWQIGTVLRVMMGRRLYREMGYATLELYVESRLGMSYRKASFLVNVERRSWSATRQLREAYRDGRLTPLKAGVLMRLLNEEFGNAWIARAGEVTLRRLEDEVAWALHHIDEGLPGHGFAPPPPDLDVRAELAAAIDTIDLQMRAHAAWEDGPRESLAGANLQFEVPVSVARLAEEALQAVRRGWEPRWRTFERMVALAVLEWTSLPSHRDPVFARDGWRCSVPGCTSRRELHDHHLRFLSRLGSNHLDNRTTVCAAHHLHGLHGDVRVRATGAAPSAVLWELGCRPGREPLMRLLGDRYLVAA